MHATVGPWRNERGMILFVSLTILSLLVAVGLGVIVSTQNDSKVTANLRSATETFYVAEAGLAWAKDQLSRLANNPPAPVDSTLAFSGGSFSVSFLTPNKVSALVAHVVIRSNGVSRDSAQAIQARVTKTYDLADGALSLKGHHRVSFNGNSFFISGLNHDPTNGQVLFGDKPTAGISVANEVSLREVRDRLTIEQLANVTGNEAGAGAISLSEFLPVSAVAKIGEELCNHSQALKQAIPADGTLAVGDLLWGTRSNPQLRCIEGLSGSGDAVALSGGSTGAGILLVKNADLVVSGSFRWEGLVVVTGENVSFRVAGSETKEIYGSVIVNESNPAIGSGQLTLDLQGALRVRYSRAALARSAELIPPSLMDSLYHFLPATITQDYWRALTP
jgi:Tfp pilus assembly protein PilX